MALLKAFVCQVVLFGLYKLFLEQVVVDHLVPDELTRNCLVGFVIFMCFGIQLYTDKAEDDLAENGEDTKTKSKSRESTGATKLEPTEISLANETDTKTVVLDTSSPLINTKKQTASQEISKEKQHSQIQQVLDFKEENMVLPSAEEVTKNSHPGIFAKFSTNVPDKIGSTDKTSYESESKTFPVLNGLSEINVSQESEEDGIEIDQLVCKESCKAAEKLTTSDADVYTTKPDHAKEAVNESENLPSNAIKDTSTKDFDPMIDESEELITVKSEACITNPEHLTKAVNESENLPSNGVNDTSTKDFDSDPMIDEPEQLITVKSEACITNPEHATKALNESENLPSNTVNDTSAKDFDSDPMIDEPEQLITVKSEENYTFNPPNGTEADMESEHLISNGMNNSSKQDLNPDQMIDELEQLLEVKLINEEHLEEAMGESEYSAFNGVKTASKPDLDSKPGIDESELHVINGTVMEWSNITDEIPSNMTKKNEINSKKDDKEVGDDRQIISTDASETDVCSTDITKPLPSAQDVESTSTISVKTVNKERTVIKNNVEASTAVNPAVLSTRRKISVSESAYVSYFPIDISFIYACH